MRAPLCCPTSRAPARCCRVLWRTFSARTAARRLTDSVETKSRLRKTLSALPGIGFADPFPNDLEVIAGDIDKGTALVFLLDKLAIPREACLAMGDGGSDLPMLKAAGVGVAMAGSGEELIQAADFVTTGCDEDGVAMALERFVLESRKQP